MIIGTDFRPLLHKQQDQQPIVVTLTSGSSLQPGTTKFKRYLRTFWNCARHDTATTMPLGLDAERYAEFLFRCELYEQRQHDSGWHSP